MAPPVAIHFWNDPPIYIPCCEIVPVQYMQYTGAVCSTPALFNLHVPLNEIGLNYEL
jgi:hypothetical protein